MPFPYANHEIFEEGEYRARVKFVERMCTKQYNIWLSEGHEKKICSDERFLQMCKNVRLKSANLGWWFVTVNPP